MNRNEQIFEDVLRGESLTSVGKRYDITGARVRQIVANIRRKAVLNMRKIGVTDAAQVGYSLADMRENCEFWLHQYKSLAEFKDATRTTEQNALMWPLLGCVAEQVQWDGEWLTDEQWKDLFTAVLRKQKCVRGLEGGIVFLGGRTSRMGTREFSDLIELIYSFGAERGVKFGDVREAA